MIEKKHLLQIDLDFVWYRIADGVQTDFAAASGDGNVFTHPSQSLLKKSDFKSGVAEFDQVRSFAYRLTFNKSP